MRSVLQKWTNVPGYTSIVVAIPKSNDDTKEHLYEGEIGVFNWNFRVSLREFTEELESMYIFPSDVMHWYKDIM